MAADYKQLEVRILAHLSDDSALQAVLSSSTDLFVAMASRWLGKVDVSADDRKMAKQLAYGIIYGKGNAAIAEDLNVSVAEARRKHLQFLKLFPGILQFTRSAVATCQNLGYVRTMLRRKRLLPNVCLLLVVDSEF